MWSPPCSSCPHGLREGQRLRVIQTKTNIYYREVKEEKLKLWHTKFNILLFIIISHDNDLVCLNLYLDQNYDNEASSIYSFIILTF